MWPRAFMAVPTEDLTLDPETSRHPGKYAKTLYESWMRNVPEIYRLRHEGLTDADFHRLANSPTNDRERNLGETYRNLFSTSPSAAPIRASFHEGSGLVVDAGQHRTAAAARLGLPYVPVHVSAPDEYQLDRLRTAFEGSVRQRTPDLPNVPNIHRDHHQQHYPERTREVVRMTDPAAGNSEIEREIGRERRAPERER